METLPVSLPELPKLSRTPGNIQKSVVYNPKVYRENKESIGVFFTCPFKGPYYAHIEIVVAFLVVRIFSCLIIASYGVGVMTWEFGEMFSYVSSTLLYLLEAKIQAIDPSFFTPDMFGKNNYFHLSVKDSRPLRRKVFLSCV